METYLEFLNCKIYLRGEKLELIRSVEDQWIGEERDDLVYDSARLQRMDYRK